MDVTLKCGRANSGVFAAKTGSQRNAAPVWECDRHAQFLHPSTEYEVDTFTVHSQRSFLQDFAAILQFDGHGRDDLSPNVEGFLLVCLLMIEGGAQVSASCWFETTSAGLGGRGHQIEDS